MEKLLLSLFVILLSSYLNAQNSPPLLNCGTDEMHQQLFQDRSELNSGIISAYEQLQNFTHNFESTTDRSNDPYIIPVVFHVIHNYGPENISDAQIYDAVEQVNLQLRKLNADTTDIIPDFENIATDTEIEIRMARKDPDGNCTNGITRSVSPTTMVGDHEVKSVIQWPPDQYLNIYVCNQASGLAGHAMMPAPADTIPEWDGIVMQHSYVGTIGTSDYFRRTVLTHEIGHYLNLQHIWGGNNVPDYYYLPVAQATNCDHDDDVADTPETIGWQSCNTSSESCGSLDNVQNYMDYAYCARMFTEGQKQRMHACLNSNVANRNNLWTPANLAATGTDGSYDALCAVSFDADERVICEGETLEFVDYSYHGITDRVWAFDGGSASNTSDSMVTVTYNTPGKYDVTLTISNEVDQESVTLSDFITVLPASGTDNYLTQTFEIPSYFESTWYLSSGSNPLSWNLVNYGSNSEQSLFVDNYNLSNGPQHILTSYPIDASELNELILRFDVAYAKKEAVNSDFLRIQVSTNCGETWTTRGNFSSNTLESVNNPIENTAFYPTSQSEWKTLDVTSISSAYLTDNLMIRFLFQSGGGNNVFLDNIQVAHPDALNLSNNSDVFYFNLFPNPAQNSLTIESTEQIKSFIITNPQGKVVKNQILNSNQMNFEVPLHHLSNGMYLIYVTDSNGKVITKRFVVTD